MNFPKGTILISKHANAIHPIVYLEKNDGPYFLGLMLTKDTTKENLKMQPGHFTDGFKYKNTHVVNAFLLKPNEWEPFKIIGRLTAEGIKFIQDNVQELQNPILWEDYVAAKA